MTGIKCNYHDSTVLPHPPYRLSEKGTGKNAHLDLVQFFLVLMAFLDVYFNFL
jgi:hypothetical protein